MDRFLSTFGANPSLVKKLAGAFLKEVPRQLGVLQEAIDAQAARDIERAAHTLKGAVSNYHYPRLVEALQEIEERAGKGQLDGLSSELPRLAQMVGDMEHKMATVLAGDGA